MPSYQKKRLESTLLNIINHTLKYEIYDNVVKNCSITYVKLCEDNGLAIAYVDYYDLDRIAHVVEKLNAAKGVFRTAIAKNTTLYHVPQIEFIADQTIINAKHIDDLIKNNKK